jgi:hypothetical protein
MSSYGVSLNIAPEPFRLRGFCWFLALMFVVGLGIFLRPFVPVGWRFFGVMVLMSAVAIGTVALASRSSYRLFRRSNRAGNITFGVLMTIKLFWILVFWLVGPEVMFRHVSPSRAAPAARKAASTPPMVRVQRGK